MKYSTTIYKAIKKFGKKNQILKCIEELNELASILAKSLTIPTVPNETSIRDKVIEEYTDVLITMHYVYHIFQLTDEEIDQTIDRKYQRLEKMMEE
jgi:predicted RNase H-related nuclease YkuK (DUF458 family)